MRIFIFEVKVNISDFLFFFLCFGGIGEGFEFSGILFLYECFNFFRFVFVKMGGSNSKIYDNSCED